MTLPAVLAKSKLSGRQVREAVRGANLAARLASLSPEQRAIYEKAVAGLAGEAAFSRNRVMKGFARG